METDRALYMLTLPLTLNQFTSCACVRCLHYWVLLPLDGLQSCVTNQVLPWLALPGPPRSVTLIRLTTHGALTAFNQGDVVSRMALRKISRQQGLCCVTTNRHDWFFAFLRPPRTLGGDRIYWRAASLKACERQTSALRTEEQRSTEGLWDLTTLWRCEVS